MFVFGHLGITLGITELISGIVAVRQKSIYTHKPDQGQNSKFIYHQPKIDSGLYWPGFASKFLDIRFLLLGSMLPDIIDKPIGILVLDNGRIFTHSLLVTIILLAVGALLYAKYKRTGILAMGAGTSIHLICDQMWMTSQILFWPFLGWRFPDGASGDIFHVWVSMLFSQPVVYIPELIGLIVIFIFTWHLVKNRKITIFLKHGKVT